MEPSQVTSNTSLTSNETTNIDINKQKMPLITVSGTNEEIGRQLGTILKDRIHLTLDFYKGVFNRSEEEIFKYAKMFRTSIKSFNADYATEIETLAETVEVDPLWIYALNARSEIMNKFQNECTASYFKSTTLLGQNWDWAKELEDLVVIVRIKQPNKPDILQMTEPGIVGKIGLNSEGLGVCLNFLHIPNYDPSGVPTHVLLRGVLDCKTIEEAKNLVQTHSKGRTSNFIVGDSHGKYFDVEFAGDDQYILNEEVELYLHTNHYLGKRINPDTEEFSSSYRRYERASEILKNLKNPELEEFKRLLRDQKNKKLPICRPYVKPKNKLLKTAGTVCSIIMDLKEKSIHITRGNPFENPFEEIQLN